MTINTQQQVYAVLVGSMREYNSVGLVSNMKNWWVQKFADNCVKENIRTYKHIQIKHLFKRILYYRCCMKMHCELLSMLRGERMICSNRIEFDLIRK